MSRPRCVIVTGRPGSGKTTLAKKLGQELWMPVISRDEIKEGYVNTHDVRHDQLPETTNRVVSDLFLELVCQCLAGKVSIVIEAAFQHKVWEPMAARIREWADLFVVICEIDATVAARRHLQRGLDEPRREFYHGDHRVHEFRATGIVLPPGDYQAPELGVPTARVGTDGDYEPSIESLAERIRSTS